jgi:hypothetical protein
MMKFKLVVKKRKQLAPHHSDNLLSIYSAPRKQANLFDATSLDFAPQCICDFPKKKHPPPLVPFKNTFAINSPNSGFPLPT